MGSRQDCWWARSYTVFYSLLLCTLWRRALLLEKNPIIDRVFDTVCLFTGKLWCAKKNKRKRKKLLYNAHRNDGTTVLSSLDSHQNVIIVQVTPAKSNTPF